MLARRTIHRDIISSINVLDIPLEGVDLDGVLDSERLGLRVNNVSSNNSLHYTFVAAPTVSMSLDRKSSTVFIKGEVSAIFKTPCARCAEEVTEEVVSQFELVVEQRSRRIPDEDQQEDLHISFHDGVKIDLEELVEDYLILGLPYTVVCFKDEAERIACDSRLKRATVKSDAESEGDARMAIFRELGEKLAKPQKS